MEEVTSVEKLSSFFVIALLTYLIIQVLFQMMIIFKRIAIFRLYCFKNILYSIGS